MPKVLKDFKLLLNPRVCVFVSWGQAVQEREFVPHQELNLAHPLADRICHQYANAAVIILFITPENKVCETSHVGTH